VYSKYKCDSSSIFTQLLVQYRYKYATVFTCCFVRTRHIFWYVLDMKKDWFYCKTLICFNISEINIHHRAKGLACLCFGRIPRLSLDQHSSVVCLLFCFSGRISRLSLIQHSLYVGVVEKILPHHSQGAARKDSPCVNLIGCLSSDCWPIRIICGWN